MSVKQSPVGRESLCIAGGPAESTVSFESPEVISQVEISEKEVEPVIGVDALAEALSIEGVEHFRPLLPVGYEAAAEAYRKAALTVTAEALSAHYSKGLQFFHEEFTPFLKERVRELSGGAWDLEDFEAFAAGSDVDLMTHLIEAVAATRHISLYPGDWFGFQVGSTHQDKIVWSRDSAGTLACLCVPSVRNGHFTREMVDFLQAAESCLLNLNLFPTLQLGERRAIAEKIKPHLGKSVLSISFSRGFGLTVSQLGVILIPKDHPLLRLLKTQLNWFTYYFNAIAGQAFMKIDIGQLRGVDEKRREWVADWLAKKRLPVVNSGTYYIKSFRIEGRIPEVLRPLLRAETLRLCFKPSLYGIQ